MEVHKPTHLQDLPLLSSGDFFGIWFYPGALRFFFNINVSEISNSFVESSYLPHSDFNALHQHIYQQSSFPDRVHVCEKWLLNHYNPIPINPIDHALHLLYQSYGRIQVQQVSKEVGWSSRHLNRQFSSHIGMNLKTFSRIIRIQNACRMLYSTPKKSLETALEAGYFDQSHSIKDFKKILTCSPCTFNKHNLSDFYNNKMMQFAKLLGHNT